MILDDFANLWFKTFGDFCPSKLGFFWQNVFGGWGWGMRDEGWICLGWGWLSFWGSISLVEMVNMN